MHVTVTGGTGFLGGFLVRDLLAKGTPVRVLARPSPRAAALQAAGAEIVTGDLGDPDSIARAVEGAEIVYHLAAKVGAAPQKEYFAVNVGGTERVLNACAQHGVKQILYASSLAVYGPVKEGERIDEDTAFDAHPELRDPYAQSKIAADRLVSAFARQTGMPVVILREGIIFGPGRPLPNGIFGFSMGKTNIVFGRPTNHFPLNYVENLVDAMQAAAETGKGLREYNVLDDDELTLARYHAVKTAADGSTTRFVPGLAPLCRRITDHRSLAFHRSDGRLRLSRHQLRRSLQDRRYDTGRIRKEIGWRPRWSLSEAIGRTLRAKTPHK